MTTAPTQITPAEEFYDLRGAIDERLAEKGLPPSKFATSVLEASEITARDIEELKAHMEKLMAIEGRRNFWLGFATNAGFFLLGVIAAKL